VISACAEFVTSVMLEEQIRLMLAE
jgi:hypothetical protein